MRIWKALSFIRKTFTNDQKMPQSNLTHYQQHTINKQHTNGISATESQCGIQRSTRMLLMWRYCVLVTTVSPHTTTPHRGHGWNQALNKCSLNKQCFFLSCPQILDCPLFIFSFQSPINSTFPIKIPVSFPFLLCRNYEADSKINTGRWRVLTTQGDLKEQGWRTFTVRS